MGSEISVRPNRSSPGTYSHLLALGFSKTLSLKERKKEKKRKDKEKKEKEKEGGSEGGKEGRKGYFSTNGN